MTPPPPPVLDAILLVHAGSTLAMLGLIWFVQLAHYPLYHHVGRETFVRYQAAHMSRTTWVVAPLMLAELGTAGLLAIGWRPAGVAPWQAWAGLALVGALWISTAFVQVPRHNVLTKGYDEPSASGLVATNWFRTAAWSARGVLALWMVGGALAAARMGA